MEYFISLPLMSRREPFRPPDGGTWMHSQTVTEAR